MAQNNRTGYERETQSEEESIIDSGEGEKNDMFSGISSVAGNLGDTQIRKRRFLCQHCNKTFASKDILKVHQRLHTGERPFQCSQCGKTFALKDTLRVHQRLHTGERPFQCNQCGQTFITRSHLTRHQRTHSGERPFLCDTCGRRFNHKYNMKIHQRTHLERRTSQAPLCVTKNNKDTGNIAVPSDISSSIPEPNKEVSFMCNTGGAPFDTRSSMSRQQTGEHPLTNTFQASSLEENRTQSLNIVGQQNSRTGYQHETQNKAESISHSVTPGNQDPGKIAVPSDISSSIPGPNKEVSFMCNTGGAPFDTRSSVSRQQTEEHPPTNAFQSLSLEENRTRSFNIVGQQSSRTRYQHETQNVKEIGIYSGNQDGRNIEVPSAISSSIPGPNKEVSFMCNTRGAGFDTWSRVSRQQTEEHPPTNTLQASSLEENRTQPLNIVGQQNSRTGYQQETRNVHESISYSVTTDNQDGRNIEVPSGISASIPGPNEVSFLCNTRGSRFDTWISVSRQQIEEHPPTNTFQASSLEENRTQSLK